MDEGDPGSPTTVSRLPVDEEGALRLEVGKGSFDVYYRVGDMVKPFAMTLQESTHRRVGSECGQELDEGTAHRQHGLLNSLFLDHLPVHRCYPVAATMVLDRLVEVVDCNSYMIEVQQLHFHSVTWRRRRTESGTVAAEPPDQGYRCPVRVSLPATGTRLEA